MEITVENILKELKFVLREAKNVVKHDKDGFPIGKKIDFKAITSATDQLGKYLGMWSENTINLKIETKIVENLNIVFDVIREEIHDNEILKRLQTAFIDRGIKFSAPSQN
jgi:hypothetical protein